MTHLWEIDHPYYCERGNYFKAGQHARWTSWQEFRDETLFVTGDRDMNLLFRWDWSDGVLSLFFMLQRKSYHVSHDVAVTREDEPEIRAWLTECAEALRATWEPILTADGA
ncbi:hypothetical protein OS965_02235 [Streptomyces sp. H27-G5]|uniref:hypothetical protein n=1 Tax=Streptomyces sp. H27-G5 TaxID=2996698 RepID=UPI00227059E2|nr:hypothetical protein [Streptomyces sp. H27-G5]MCY0916994.1 hypothetical protein [Streptomyces sp. H27-G5]